MDLGQTNEWNARYLFARALMDESGGLVIQQNLIMTGGIPERGLRSYFKIYRNLIVGVLDAQAVCDLAKALSAIEETELMELELIRL